MIIAIIQARMGSTRLPGKVLMQIDGKPMLEYQIERVKKAKLIDTIVVATSVLRQDDPIGDICNKIGIDCFRGSENDVLSRYYECAKKYQAKTIVRLTADCPFSDPEVIDKVIQLFIDAKADYAANTAPPQNSTFPDGSDVEVFSMEAFEKVNKEAKDKYDREHVTFYFWKYGKDFKTAQLISEINWSKYRFTVDYSEDYDVAKYAATQLKEKGIFGHIGEIIEIIESNQEIKAKNSKYYFGIGWKKTGVC